jgi:hypothetical protein
MPKRIQRKRTRGWRIPPNTVYVGRPTKWGNPFACPSDPAYAVAAFKKYLHSCIGQGDFGFIGPRLAHYKDNLPMEVRIGSTRFRGENNGRDKPFIFRASAGFARPLMMVQCPDRLLIRATLIELYGKDLCCWCPLDEPCHADVLLEIANGGAK